VILSIRFRRMMMESERKAEFKSPSLLLIVASFFVAASAALCGVIGITDGESLPLCVTAIICAILLSAFSVVGVWRRAKSNDTGE